MSNVVFLLACKILFASYLKFSFNELDDIVMINFFISASLLMALRIVVKDLFKFLDEPAMALQKENILIDGSGSSSILIKKTIEAQKCLMSQVKGFVDSRADKRHFH
jgi:hypothetical protein